MKESLTARVGRIISGGAHKVVEAIENAAPEAVMEQAVREVDGVIDEVRAELGSVSARKHLASERLMEENRRHEELTEKSELAIKESREDLAEAAIAKQLDIEAQIPVLENTITGCSEREKELEGMISALRARKREMEEDLRQYRLTHTGTPVGNPAPNAEISRDRRVETAQSAFDRVMEKKTGLSGRGVSQDEAKLAELEELSRKNRIRERLAAARAKLSTS
jgi:phage shock protein A